MLVKTASNSKLGATVLVDARGMTLYHLSGEQNGKFICTSATCVKVWAPLKANSSGTPSGTVGSLGKIKRPDGTEQVTYKGMPLYTFAHDMSPGQANGEGIKDVGTWTAVTTSAATTGAATTSIPAPTTSSSSGGGSYGY
jgi:predicted lipoprotein with Yx(FWY)xxD motif